MWESSECPKIVFYKAKGMGVCIVLPYKGLFFVLEWLNHNYHCDQFAASRTRLRIFLVNAELWLVLAL